MFLLALLVTGCAEMHGRSDDAGPPSDAARTCAGRATFYCVSACGTDAGLLPVCADGAWTCPPEAPIDSSTCPPGCVGAPPPGCSCLGTEWICEGTECPPDLDPWTPGDPSSACRIEGATCSSGSTEPCGGSLSCTCRSGHWSCGLGSPDPVCWCGREASEGDPCVEEGALCGSCCPTPEGPSWPAMTCLGGRWTAPDCPAECPPVIDECPVDTAAVVGTLCANETQLCGNPCCDSAITCREGRWQRGPFAACACEPDYACGPGSCTRYQACGSRCGPDDGIEHYCIGLSDGCRDCSCVALTGAQTCEMVDGHPQVSEPLFCG